MSIEVIFRGVGLFTTAARDKLRVLDAFIIPDTRGEQNTSGGNLPRHYARLVVLDNTGSIVARYTLDDTSVVISDAFAGDCVLQSSFDRVQDFDEAMNATAEAIGAAASPRNRKKTPADIRLRPLNGSKRTRSRPEGVTSVVHIFGGAMSAHEQASVPWRTAQDNGTGNVNPNASPAALVTWRSNSPSATIKIASAAGENSLVLDANRPKAYLYHFDDEWASIAQLSGFDDAFATTAASPPPLTDEDFKWLYGLTTVDPTKHWSALKAPYILPQDLAQLRGRNPGSGTGCFSARK